MNKNKIVILVGPSGSGKSSFARLYCESFGHIYINADTMRAVVGESESDQSYNHIVFSTLDKMVKYFCKLGLDILIDNTNLTRKARKQWIDIANKFEYEVEMHVFKTPKDVCIKRDLERKRNVGEKIIQNQFDRMEIPDFSECSNINFHNL